MKYNEFNNLREKPATEVAPPGREKQVKALKGKVDNPYAVAWASYNKSKGKNEDHEGNGIQSVDIKRIDHRRYSDKQIKMAFGVLNDPKFKGGNYSGAYNVINKIAPGLADHPSVANALRRANEGFIGKKPEYNDFLQNKLDQAIQEYDTPEKKAERDALMKHYLAKGGTVEKVPTGKTAYKDKELKPAFKKDNGTPTTSPMSDESVDEDAPFGDGMALIRMALMRKFITAEEWFNLKDELKAAGEEVEQRYDDWPEGEGFGSSDGNFAIKELMGKAGYEFDEQDKGGRFIVTKMPEKLEKMGIKNARMQGEPVKAEAGMPASIIKHKQKLAMMSDEELANRYKDFDEDKLRHMAWSHGYGKMSSHYWDRVQAGKKDDHREISRIMKYESKLANMLNQRLK